MKTLKTIIAAFAILLVTTSAFADRQHDAAIGEKAPALVLANDSTTLALEQLKGQWVVLSFWSAADAHSRLASHSVFSLAGNNEPLSTAGGTPVTLLSVNLDRSEQLMREIMKIDGTESASMPVFHLDPADSATERICRSWAMTKGLRTFIINPEGEIEAVDPTEKRLRALIAA